MNGDGNNVTNHIVSLQMPIKIRDATTNNEITLSTYKAQQQKTPIQATNSKMERMQSDKWPLNQLRTEYATQYASQLLIDSKEAVGNRGLDQRSRLTEKESTAKWNHQMQGGL